ncbi:NAD(P)-dependent oxidoreductase [Sporosarcina pasteurii]|uniref:2-(Hydroxymethyl)glutarate dehydrogenase n=1 Tax=Sporosarcina pasteurii TaxID=1474 RepID=A0A380BEA7_SPOPA|nr:NAD(P)-dependent oxidoreductase [Sporosarcina pasteurii]MDS9472548.1 NAD(P)-dependent oxidoreductase [Sporosarcina pasteurii]QBQ06101.1 NAD(P)-dependent oxidoreductase [Sporosarcina pasteurii]SUI99436.1 2-(hydroxymethyl)glutarate dehydrogenase [Sporosarcina pasteurii]
MTNEKKIGFIGLGNMGFPMAKNLLAKGYTVYGLDLNKDSEHRLAALGGKTGLTTASLVNEVDLIFTSLPTPQIAEAVFLGEDGIIQHCKKPTTLVDLSTISPDVNRKVAKAAEENNLDYLGAPVSGSVSGAVNATLAIMVGGNKTTYDAVLPYLEVLGANVFHVGDDPGAGTIVKLINNLMAGFHNQAVAEALTIAERAGLDKDIVYDIVNVSSGQSTLFTRNYKTFISQDEYIDGAFATALLLKDLKLAKDYADSVHGKLPLSEKLIEFYESAVEEGYADKDMSSVYVMIQEEINKQLQEA